jgi:uncharacterized membrane protein
MLRTQAEGADLESRIGSHWLNRIGIAAVLIGVSYFLKYAFDNNWIGPAGRVTIGLLAGIAVVIWSERFRSHGYQIFSYSLKAVGIGVLYLSLWAAFHVYSLIPSGIAFVAMLVVTASTAVLAITQDAEILGAFALTGGYTTPLLLSTGANKELQLFSYVALLDVAAVVMVARKPWRRLLALAYAGTLILYIGWYSEFYSRSQLNLTVAFATLFFAIFAVALSVSVYGDHTRSLTITIDNGDDPPLPITKVQPQSVERRLYFEPQGKTSLKLYYGDDQLAAPVYDYAKLFREEENAALAQLGAEAMNSAYSNRPDERPWSERHKAVLWAALLLAVAVLGSLAFRGLMTEARKAQ